jgi:Domain of unknown function (DUF4395)
MPAIDSTTGRGLVPIRSEVSDRSLGAWMRANLTTQGYCITDQERCELSLALRFSTATCLVLVATALALESPVMIFALSGVGLVAGLTARHPFDLLWNHGVRRLTGGPALPPNPTRRRHAFKIATVWLLLLGGLLTAGATTVALALGGLLLAACATVTATNLCLPSEMFAWWDRHRMRRRAAATWLGRYPGPTGGGPDQQ